MNPWFRDANDPNVAGMDGWTRESSDDVSWGLSQKDANPAPDIVISGRCGNDPVYCGTAARWADMQQGVKQTVTYPNVDVYLHQVIAADPTGRTLKFSTHWVSHRVEVAEVSVYGSHTDNGPWTLLWAPFFHSQDEVIVPPSGDQADLWEATEIQEMTLDTGYSYYKVEIHARLPEGDGVGFKITGLYFAIEGEEEGPIVPDSKLYLPIFRRK